MMLFLFEITDITTAASLLVSIPESLGLLLFGVGLVVLAISVRSFLSRCETESAANEA